MNFRYEKTKAALIREAIVEADKGVFVSQEAVTEWFLLLETDQEIAFPQADVYVNDRQGGFGVDSG